VVAEGLVPVPVPVPVPVQELGPRRRLVPVPAVAQRLVPGLAREPALAEAVARRQPELAAGEARPARGVALVPQRRALAQAQV
jgi:hypothetical protein